MIRKMAWGFWGAAISCSMAAAAVHDTATFTVNHPGPTVVNDFTVGVPQGSSVVLTAVAQAGTRVASVDSTQLQADPFSLIQSSTPAAASLTMNTNPAAAPRGYPLAIGGTYTPEQQGASGAGGEVVYEWEGRAKVVVDPLDLQLRIPPAIRRRYGDNDPGEVSTIQIKGTKDARFNLKIELNSGEGDATFEDGSKSLEYTGTGQWEEIKVIGVQESTREHNLRITATASNGQTVTHDDFIVFSHIEFGFSSNVTQHKDTDAPCAHCDAQTGVDHAHRHEVYEHNQDGWPKWVHRPCSHESFHPMCGHCAAYCLRACMSIIYGGEQDSFLELGKATVEANHGVYLSVRSALANAQTRSMNFKSLSQRNYENVFKILINNHQIIGGRGRHAYIIHGLRWNYEDGNIEDNRRNKVFQWDPIDASQEVSNSVNYFDSYYYRN